MRVPIRSYMAAVKQAAGWKVAAALCLMVLYSLTEGVGIALLLPTLQAAGLDLAHQGDAGRYAKAIASAVAAIGLPPTLPVLLAIFVVLVSTRAALTGAQSVAMISVNQAVALALRTRLYGAIANAGWLFVARSRASDFTHALTAEIDRVALATLQLMMLGSDAVLIVVYLAVALALSPPMTAMVLGAGALLTFAVRGRTRRVHESGRAISEASNRLYAAASEHVQSLKAVKTYGAQQRSAGIFAALSADVARSMTGAARQQALASSMFEVGSILALGVVIYVSIGIAVPGAEILILLLLFSRVMPRMMSANGHYQTFLSLLPAFTNVMGVEERCRAAAEPPQAPGEPLQLHTAVRLERVWFAYGTGEAVIRDLDLVIPAGRVTAIVGPSGVGKSTLADLMMGLIAPGRGRVTIDGVALDAAHARGWREQIGYVGQETFLFHDTVRANLSWARPGATEPEMLEALSLAAAEEFVRGLPAGLETIVGDRGILLSQGERQRIALARAMLRRPAMLLLDEATNSLDSDNETKVLGAIERLRGDLTTVLIAHRLSTIRWADLIYVIESGRVVESGDWQTLSSRDGPFRALCEAQSLGA
ncbi:MAG: ABC transporter ATP-binding protein [Candidatus Binatales bacterium]